MTNETEPTTIALDDLDGVTGGGWKGKAAKAAKDFAVWTGVPSAIGGAAAGISRWWNGPSQPQQPQQPQQEQTK